jgi:pimeloyl-ACP methyl ester carboxylesterase
LSTILILSAAIVWGVGWHLSKPANRPIKMPDGYEPIVFNGTHGSFLKSGDNGICALLIHGVRSNRMSMIDRSIFLKEIGISSLLIDLQAHGETPGEMITFGIRESVDTENGVNYLRNIQSCVKVVAIGQSLGGASALLGSGPIKVDALVLESVYPTIEEAVKDRLEMRFGVIGKYLAPLLYWQIPLRIDTSLPNLRPIDMLKKVKVPVFIISGSKDRHTKAEETKRMFETANETKLLWLIDGAAHEDLYSYDPEEYRARIIGFVEQSLKKIENIK